VGNINIGGKTVTDLFGIRDRSWGMRAAGVMIGAAALHGTGNYHTSIITVSLVGMVGLFSSLFLKMSLFSTAMSEEKVRLAGCGKMKPCQVRFL
jgi:hypothetical protein